MWIQKQLRIGPKSRGFHLITDEVSTQLPELAEIELGTVHLFLQHSSASLSLNENADPSVRRDMERHFLNTVPDDAPYYEHTLEGPDDMTAHIKTVTIGCEVTIPVSEGRMALGVWQGIYLGEHRVAAGGREMIATLHGKSKRANSG